jgi:uncharacterized membrane protein
MATSIDEYGTRDERPRTKRSQQNVGGLERAASVAAGGALAAYALKRRGLGGLVVGLLGGALLERGVTGHCHVYGALGLDSAAGDSHPRVVQRHGRAAVLDASKGRRVVRAVTIADSTPDELFAFWRNFENLPRIMQHLERVEIIDDTRSRWTVKAPVGQTVEWEAEIYNEVPGQLIAWRTLHDADVPNAGSVRFRPAPGGRGTEVRVEIDYAPPAGRVGALVAKLFGEDPDGQVREDLRRFKQLIEAGEIAVSEIPGQGRRARTTWDAKASNDPTLATFAADRPAPHDARHVPPPADVARASTAGDADTLDASGVAS